MEILGHIEDNEEVQAHAPPPSLVPRLHAILCGHLKHVNPLVPDIGTDEYKTGKLLFSEIECVPN